MKLKHPYDNRTQLNYTVWHDDPSFEAVVRHVIENVKPDRWVETGSHLGWSSAWVAENYPGLSVHTVEVDPVFYAKARDNLEPYPQVKTNFGSSPDFLRSIFSTLNEGVSVFWLDAHWWPPVPLRDECKIISSLNRYVCLIDDFASWKPDFGGDIFYSVAPNHGAAYLNDVAYVASELGGVYYRPIWEPKPGYKGVGLFMKNVDYVPPPELMRRETIDEFFDMQPGDAEKSKFYNVPHPLVLHESCVRNTRP